ncbi:MAG: substrate-binding domain-containing protein [Candidatus Aminicenantes bacterium]|nr:MAG: substrate-binding domain-containing protein [Candidatus Aminicenantes bacterium]
MKRKKIIILLVLSCLFASAFAFARSFAVIVHPDNPGQTLTAKELKMIFLGEKTTWPDKQPLKVAALKKGDTHKEFLKDIVKISPMKFAVLWKHKIFTGSAAGTHINFFKNDEKLKDYIKANPTAIGYISVNSVDDTIKEIKITR